MTIKVQDAVLSAAQILGIGEEVESYLSGRTSELGERYAALLLQGFQAVEDELALDYLPLITEEELVTTSGSIGYGDLSEPVARIFCVEDEWGKSLKYKLFADHIQTQKGKVKIIYGYAPLRKSLSDKSEYSTSVSERLFAYGIAAEYALMTGDFEGASAWEKKYKDAVRAAYRLQPCKKIRSRRWI